MEGRLVLPTLFSNKGKEMNRDENFNIIQDPPSNDGGDSLNRDGQFACLDILRFQINKAKGALDHKAILRTHLVGSLSDPQWTRNALQEPWNNPKNCTRDQINPAIIALGLLGEKDMVSVSWWQMIGRKFFYPNVERDYPGTKKSLFPIYLKKGERIEDTRWATKDGWKWEPNAADLCGPNDIAMFLRALGNKMAYPIIFLLDAFLVIGSITHCLSYARDKDNVDDMQFLLLLCQSKAIMPTPLSWASRKLFIALRPRNLGNEEHIDNRTLNKITLLPSGEIDDPIMGAIAWYFRPPWTRLKNGTDRGGFDSPMFVDMWRPVVKWLKA